MGLKSKRKGQRGELEVVHLLKSLGFSDARRTAQVRGKNGGCADVECLESLPNIHIEVKNNSDVFPGTKLFERAYETADEEANGKNPVLFWKSRGVWFATANFGSAVRSHVNGDVDMRNGLLIANDIDAETEASGG